MVEIEKIVSFISSGINQALFSQTFGFIGVADPRLLVYCCNFAIPQTNLANLIKATYAGNFDQWHTTARKMQFEEILESRVFFIMQKTGLEEEMVGYIGAHAILYVFSDKPQFKLCEVLFGLMLCCDKEENIMKLTDSIIDFPSFIEFIKSRSFKLEFHGFDEKFLLIMKFLVARSIRSCSQYKLLDQVIYGNDVSEFFHESQYRENKEETKELPGQDEVGFWSRCLFKMFCVPKTADFTEWKLFPQLKQEILMSALKLERHFGFRWAMCITALNSTKLNPELIMKTLHIKLIDEEFKKYLTREIPTIFKPFPYRYLNQLKN